MSDSAHPASANSSSVDSDASLNASAIDGDGERPDLTRSVDTRNAQTGIEKVADMDGCEGNCDGESSSCENRQRGSKHDERESGEEIAANTDAVPNEAAAVTNVEALIDDFHVLVYRYAFRLSGNQADAEDLTQQTFLAAQQNLSQLRHASKARSWLLTICRNRFLKSCRRQQPLAVSATDIEIEKIPAHTKPQEHFDREKLQQVVQDLPDEYRVVVMMFYFEQLSYREIAEQLNVAMGTVMSRLSRAKARLRSVLFPEP